ncbi:restriction endonuclease subunit S [Olivibacter ginsenosidimutans]
MKLSKTLEKVIDYRGKTPKKLGGDWANNGYRALSALNVKTNGLVNIDEIKFVNESLYKLWMKEEVLKGDILLTSEAPAGQILIWESEEKIVLSQRLFALRVNNKNHNYFIKYFLQSDIGQTEIFRNTSGSTVFGISAKMFDLINVPNISRSEQVKIGKALKCLDDKIQLNNKINAELEQMAKTLYDYWFVQFDFPNEAGKPYKSSGGKIVYNNVLKREIPEGWEVQVFSDWIKETKAGDWGKDIEEGNYTERVYCVRGADINGLNGKGEVKAPQRFILKNNLSKALKPNDFIIEISGGSPTQSTGRIALLTNKTFERFDTDVICSNFCKAVSLKDEKYIFNFQQEWQRLYDAGIFFGYEGKTSGIKNFLFDSFINSYKIVLPPKDIVEQYYNIVQNFEEKKQINLQQNQQLAQLRDWLLPMLMNGQVKVIDNCSNGNDEHSITIPEVNIAAESTIEYQKLEPFVTNESLEVDPRFESWLSNQGLAARGDIDTTTLREIFDAMDDEDK